MNNRAERSPIIFVRQSIMWIALLVLPFLLTGCTHSDNNAATAKRTNTLTIWRQPVNPKSDERIFDRLIAAYEKKYPEVKVVQRLFKPEEDYEAAVLNAIAAGQGPDIWEIRNDELARHRDKLAAYNSAKEPVNLENMRKQYAKTIPEEMVSGGKLYGLPLGIDPLVIFANNDHLKEAKVSELPKTWQEFTELANLLTKKADGIIFRPGFALGLVSNVDRASQILELLMLQLRTQMVDSANRTATFDLYKQDSAGGFFYPGQEAANFFASFSRPDSAWHTWDANQIYSTEAFAKGQLSMMINYLSLAPQLMALNPKLDIKIAPVPQRFDLIFPQEDLPGSVSEPIHVAKYRSLVVTKPWEKLAPAQRDAKHQRAWDFILLATEPKATAAYSEQNWLLSPYQQTAGAESGGQSAGRSSEIAPNLNTWYRGYSPRQTDRIMNETLKNIIEGGQPIDEALGLAAQMITGLLQ